eukprot:gnl/Spiro4/5489_TR2780_c0_g2_i1.p1 gnl/Spiro4/5489_TR2780_c0_g2~~gnl/Spiro4/5489_TR2780_c0_g2_i1.p1  ORF type:complete len:570 (-),score=115.71 gnl/Spiro4/5489_TR2780_c0_g2_i1:9-1718(-)
MSCLPSNSQAASELARILRGTYGPGGTDVALSLPDGSMLISNDGATILRNLDIVQPAAQLMAALSCAQDSEAGDGTTGVVLFSSELVHRGSELVALGLHPHVVSAGFQNCLEFALETCLPQVQRPLDERCAQPHVGCRTASCEPAALDVARTALTSKTLHTHGDFFASLAVRAATIQPVGKVECVCVSGGSVVDSDLIYGVVFRRPFVYAGFHQQPTRIAHARVLLVNFELEHKHQGESSKLEIATVDQYSGFCQAEWDAFQTQLNAVIATNCHVVVSSQSIGDVATQFFAAHGVRSLGRVPHATMRRLESALSTQIVSALPRSALLRVPVGVCSEYREVDFACGDWYEMFLCDDAAPTSAGTHHAPASDVVGATANANATAGPSPRRSRVATLLLRGPADCVLEEVERSLHDAVCAVQRALVHRALVPGGAAVELHLSAMLQRAAVTLTDATRAAVMNAYADALLVIPRVLAENVAVAPLPLIVESNRAHRTASPDAPWLGVDVANKCLADMRTLGVWEPAFVKRSLLQTATQVACRILLIDEIVEVPPANWRTQPGLEPERGALNPV